MKKLLLTATLLSLSYGAFADDGAFFRLEVGSSSSRKLGKDFRDIQESATADKSEYIAIGMGGPMTTSTSFTLVGDYRPNYKVSASDGTNTYSADLRSQGVRANVYYSWQNLGVIAPYFTVGVGAYRNRLAKMSVTPVGSTTATYEYPRKGKTGFMYQFGSGVDIHVTEETTLDVGYRFSDFGTFSTSTERTTVASGTVTSVEQITGKLHSHDIMVGLKYKF